MPPKRNRTWLIFPIVGLVCFALVLFSILRPEPIELRWKLSKGQVLRYKFSMSYGGTSIEGAADKPVAADVVSYLSVLEVSPEGVATIFKAEKGPVTKETLSQYRITPNDNPYQMTTRGQVIRDKEVYRREFRRVMKDMPDNDLKRLAEENEERDVEQYEAAKGLEDFVLPERPVRPGDEWTTSATLKNERGTYRYTHRYRLKEVNAGIAIIVMEQSDELLPGSATEFGATMQVQQILTREATFSVDKGLLLDLLEEKKNTFSFPIAGGMTTSVIMNRRTFLPGTETAQPNHK